jgi:hypothetical protein
MLPKTPINVNKRQRKDEEALSSPENNEQNMLQIAYKLAKITQDEDLLLFCQWVLSTDEIDKVWATCETAAVVVDDATIDEIGDCQMLYFMRLGATCLVKIGYTKNPYYCMHRVHRHQLKSELPYDWELDVEYALVTTKYHSLKKAIRALLEKTGQHVRGDWFTLQQDLSYAKLVRDSIKIMKYES